MTQYLEMNCLEGAIYPLYGGSIGRLPEAWNESFGSCQSGLFLKLQRFQKR